MLENNQGGWVGRRKENGDMSRPKTIRVLAEPPKVGEVEKGGSRSKEDSNSSVCVGGKVRQDQR